MSPLGQSPHPRKGQDENILSLQTGAVFQAGFLSRSYQTRSEETPPAGLRQLEPSSLAAACQAWLCTRAGAPVAFFCKMCKLGGRMSGQLFPTSL